MTTTPTHAWATGPAWEIRVGDVLDRLREMPEASVHMCVTSPPYWGLRDYGTASWDGGDPDCGHATPAVPHTGLAVAAERSDGNHRNESGTRAAKELQPYRSVCGRCGARRIDQQLGLEETPALYLERMVAVFREVKRVLRPDGTCWVNMGDGYVSSPNGNTVGNYSTSSLTNPQRQDAMHMRGAAKPRPAGLKPKDLSGMPWRLAFALQDDGWWLRSEIIWAKPNPMPESVTDRPTKSHEQIFLLTKSARYFYDADAIRETAIRSGEIPGGNYADKGLAFGVNGGWAGGEVPAGRNARTVWTIAEPMVRLRADLSAADRSYVLAELARRGL
jgi:site-specific DNA-methyltransferase (cytosine-N4-specific)